MSFTRSAVLCLLVDLGSKGRFVALKPTESGL